MLEIGLGGVEISQSLQERPANYMTAMLMCARGVNADAYVGDCGQIIMPEDKVSVLGHEQLSAWTSFSRSPIGSAVSISERDTEAIVVYKAHGTRECRRRSSCINPQVLQRFVFEVAGHWVSKY